LIFKQNPFDEKFKFIYEDIDWSKRLTNKKIPIIIANNLKIYHMEREKNILEKIFI
jgi:GT2 family glycosyltransferase